ncbi:hypothetical protein C8R47DRAFT_1152330, partial [Mycena vitilis]
NNHGQEGVKTVFMGGKIDVQQEYCGTIGGQSTDFSTIDTEIKDLLSSLESYTTQLKNNTLAPLDLYVLFLLLPTPRLVFPTAYPRG